MDLPIDYAGVMNGCPAPNILSDGTPTYPPRDMRYEALRRTPLNGIKVVIIGQDPYLRPGQAHGLAFSVPPGQRIPPSLVSVLNRIRDTTGHDSTCDSGDLTGWADQGVLLLNTALTVAAGKAGSHIHRWSRFTRRLISEISKRRPNCVFLLWGRHAQTMADSIVPGPLILKASHPSPLGRNAPAPIPFVECNHFNECNEWLEAHDTYPIIW